MRGTDCKLVWSCDLVSERFKNHLVKDDKTKVESELHTVE